MDRFDEMDEKINALVDANKFLVIENTRLQSAFESVVPCCKCNGV